MTNTNATVKIEDRYITVYGGYEFRNHLKAAGFRFDGTRKVWTAPIAPRPVRCLESLGFVIDVSLPEEAPEPEPEPFTDESPVALYPYQRIGISYLLARSKMILADDMGLGKTYQAVHGVGPTDTAVIICPAAVKYAWAAAIRTVWGEDATVLSGRTAPANFSGLTARFVVVNYDIVSAWLPHLQDRAVVVLDEGHMIKNRAAKRTQAVLSLRPRRRYVLSGTPLLSRPKELFTLLHWIDRLPPGYEDYYTFTARYCGGHRRYVGRREIWDDTGATHIDELAAHLKKVMLRRTKEEVLPDLPDRTRSTIDVVIASREYDRAHNDFVEWYREQTDKELGDALAMVKINKLREIAEREKIDWLVQYLESYREANVPLVIFYQHRHTVETLKEALGDDAIPFTGDMTSLQKAEAVERFQGGEGLFFLAQITAAQTGITLTRASRTLFLSLPWTPASFRQAEDRVYRIGQKNSVLTIIPQAFPIDYAIFSMLLAKQDVVKEYLSGDIGPAGSYKDIADILLGGK